MSETAAAQPGPEPPQDTAALVRQAVADTAAAREDIRQGIESILEAVRTHGDSTTAVMWLHRLADLGGDFRDRTAALREASLNELVASVGGTAPLALAPEPEPEPAPRRQRSGAHRNPGQRPLFPRAVRGVAPLGLVAALRHPLSHAWTAQQVAAAATAATAVVGVPAAVVGLSGPHAQATTVSTSQSAPPGWSTTGVPVTVPQRIASAVTKPKPDAAVSSPIAWTPAPPPPASGTPSSSSSSPQSLPVPVPQVRLVVTGSLDLGTGSSGEIRLTAFGGSVDWSASSSVAGLDLGASSGTLGAGESASVTVSILADLQALAGPGSVTITYGGGRSVTVPVSWTIIPLPLQDPVPSAVSVSLPPILGS